MRVRGQSVVTPASFLIATLQAEQKVVYTKLENFGAPWERFYPLVDSGLTAPAGVAMDKVHGCIYVADIGSNEVYKYNLKISGDKMKVSGTATTVVTGLRVKWLAVDRLGDLFLGDQTGKRILKVTRGTLQALEAGKFGAADVQVVKEEEEEDLAAAAAAEARAFTGAQAEPKQNAGPQMHSIYENPDNGHVGLPGGVATNGVQLFWDNESGGATKGSVIVGMVDPKAPLVGKPHGEEDTDEPPEAGPEKFSSSVLAQNVEKSFGMVLTFDKIFWTGEKEAVFGMPIEGGTPSLVAKGFLKPRGIAWDGDSTIYVADTAGNNIKSFACGVLQDGAALSQVISVHSPFGLATLTQRDPAWTAIGGPSSSASGRSWLVMHLLAFAAVLSTVC